MDLARALGHCRAVHRDTGAVVVIVRHLGKEGTRGARGWSGIKAAADVEITVERRGPVNRATVSKMKDGPDGTVLKEKEPTKEKEREKEKHHK